MYNGWFCVLKYLDVCVFFHFLYEWMGPENWVQFPTVSWSIIVSKSLFFSLQAASPHSATLLVTGQDRACQVLMAQTYCIYTHIHMIYAHFFAQPQLEVTDKGSWLVFFSCFDCFCLGTKCFKHTHTHTKQNQQKCCHTMVLCEGCLGLFFPSTLLLLVLICRFP